MLVIPERVVTFRNDSAFVKIVLADDGEEVRSIETGLSDAISVEVISGLALDDEVLRNQLR